MFKFCKSRRLLTREDFDRVFKNAHKLTTPEFTVLFCDNKQEQARIGLVLSKKMIHKAHDRNKIKRVLRESFRLNTKIPAVDVVVLARSGVAQAEPVRMRFNLDKLWNTLSVRHVP
ncbi:MAG: ribonuclease P protein component [Legionella sp.]|jgi:ribonuclease P protein component|nr:ribonuclease P protein component [Legionella sp.]